MTFPLICRLESTLTFAEASVPEIDLTEMAQPSPAVGDWLQAPGQGAEIELKFYTRPPLAMLLHDDSRFKTYKFNVNVQPSQLFGPVHLVSQDHPNFVSVLVPMPELGGRMAWTNIWGDGKYYCHIVKEQQLADWFRKGIPNVFQPETNVIAEKERLQQLRDRRWTPAYPDNIYVRGQKRKMM